MHTFFRNIRQPFENRTFILIYVFSVTASFLVWWYFTDVKIMFGNYGKLHTYTDIILSGIIMVVFPLFIIGIISRWMRFGSRITRESGSTVGTISGVIGTILSGSSCCGLTLASYFGLLPFMALLPYDGLEIKVLATLGVSYALWSVYIHYDVCQTPRKK